MLKLLNGSCELKMNSVKTSNFQDVNYEITRQNAHSQWISLFWEKHFFYYLTLIATPNYTCQSRLISRQLNSNLSTTQFVFREEQSLVNMKNKNWWCLRVITENVDSSKLLTHARSQTWFNGRHLKHALNKLFSTNLIFWTLGKISNLTPTLNQLTPLSNHCTSQFLETQSNKIPISIHNLNHDLKTFL